MDFGRALRISDSRSDNAQHHELDEIVMIALLATLCGGETCVDPPDLALRAAGGALPPTVQALAD